MKMMKSRPKKSLLDFRIPRFLMLEDLINFIKGTQFALILLEHNNAIKNEKKQ